MKSSSLLDFPISPLLPTTNKRVAYCTLKQRSAIEKQALQKEGINSKQELIIQKVGKSGLEYISSFVNLDFKNNFDFNLNTLIVKQPDPIGFGKTNSTTIITLEDVTLSSKINQNLSKINNKLAINEIYIGFFKTEKKWIENTLIKYFIPLNYLIIGLNSIIQLIIGSKSHKIKKTSKAELYGRLYYNGFEIISEKTVNDNLFFTAKKIGPSSTKNQKYGILINLNRIGKEGKLIKIYKLRSMYPYSEYLQEYIYKQNSLKEGGKFKNDFRIFPFGKHMRKFWIDEIPMLLNILKGDIKLVGVRPLSEQYFNLYPKELQELRTEFKPGLLPPFYVDMPKTLEGIIDSELKYLKLYAKAPIKTDIIYFFKVLSNIFFKGKRSN